MQVVKDRQYQNEGLIVQMMIMMKITDTAIISKTLVKGVIKLELDVNL